MSTVVDESRTWRVLESRWPVVVVSNSGCATGIERGLGVCQALLIRTAALLSRGETHVRGNDLAVFDDRFAIEIEARALHGHVEVSRRIACAADVGVGTGREGAIELHTEFYEPVTLQTGDSAYFDARMEHLCISVSATDALVLWVPTHAGALAAYGKPGSSAPPQ